MLIHTLTMYIYICDLFQSKNPSVPTFFTNRALCYLKMKQWELACQDCKRALEMDNTLIKGHFFHGQANMEMNLCDEAIASLMRGKGINYVFNRVSIGLENWENVGNFILGFPGICHLLQSPKKLMWASMAQQFYSYYTFVHPDYTHWRVIDLHFLNILWCLVLNVLYWYLSGS